MALNNILNEVRLGYIDDAESAVLSRMLQSRQANADVASILTQKDIDAALTPFER